MVLHPYQLKTVKAQFAREPGYPSTVETAFRKPEFMYQIVLVRSGKPSSPLDQIFVQDTTQETTGVTYVSSLLMYPGNVLAASLVDS